MVQGRRLLTNVDVAAAITSSPRSQTWGRGCRQRLHRHGPRHCRQHQPL